MSSFRRSSPLIYEYLRKFQEDPTSRVFAPLAEAYRKAGLCEEAIEIAKEGLRVHPNFIGGKGAVARALFDKKEYEDVIQELTPVINDVPDNFAAQKLVAESALMLGRVSEALSAFKMLLYLYPDNKEVAEMVRELETQAYEKGNIVLRTDLTGKQNISGFNVADIKGALKRTSEEEQEQKVKRIEFLQGLLQKVERYKAQQLG